MIVSFSERYETQRPPSLIDGEGPDKVRSRFQWLVSGLLSEREFHWLREQIYPLMGMTFSKCPAQSYRQSCDCRGRVFHIIAHSGWDEFYDIVEVFWRWFAEHYEDSLAAFESSVDKVFRECHLAYTLREGRVERVGAAEGDKIVAAAKGILRDADLAGPNDQFENALAAFNRRPEPDTENCVKDAVGAAEGVARVLLGKPAILLSNAAAELEKNYGLHPTLRQAIQKVYAYRGDAEGAAHGKTGAKLEIRQSDAEFVLNTSAAVIIYMARLFGRAVE